MYLKAAAFIKWDGTYEELGAVVGKAVGAPLIEDKSGEYEEWRSSVVRLLDLQIALLAPAPEDSGGDPSNYQVVIMTLPPADDEDEGDDDPDIDITPNLLSALRRQGLKCSSRPPPGLTPFVGILW